MASERQVYKGFSFNSPNLILNNEPLVNENLVTHLNTELASRFHMMQYGTTINNMISEPIDNTLLYDFKTQVDDVVEYDPRVTLNKDVDVLADYEANTVAGVVDLTYNILGSSDIFNFAVNMITQTNE